MRIALTILLGCLGTAHALAAEPAPASSTTTHVDGRTPVAYGPPSWPAQATPPATAPNVLVILTDDVGFGASSTFGGPVPTPTFDALAARGLRYTWFHTAAICSPTRAALLTGRTPQNVGVGNTTNLATGYPGYTSVIPKSAATVAQILQAAGYATAMFGKGHITPEWEMSQAGPFDRWPTGLGFQYFYGFLGADTSMFAPWVVENTTHVDAARGRTDYDFDADIADKAIGWIGNQHMLAPQRPFFVYFATGAAHAPNQAPAAWLAKFRGKFDQGWDQVREATFARQQHLGVIPADAALTPRPAGLPAWSTLSPERRRVYAKFMEAYAAALSFADAQIGRVIDSLKASGQYDNTLIIYVQGDNGATGEGRMHGRLFEQSGVNNLDEDAEFVQRNSAQIGGPASYPLIPAGWGWALNTPFPWYKRIASHLGGTRTGMVVSWPARIHAGGGIRSQFHYISDLLPTILEATQVPAPPVFNGVVQQPIDGVSLLYSVDDAGAPTRHQRQVFEMFENLGLYDNGWMLSTRPVASVWDADPNRRLPLAERSWELYDLRHDFSQAHDLAASQPQRLLRMQSEFWAQAQRNHILPIHGAIEGRAGMPSLSAGRQTLQYFPGLVDVPENAAPQIMRRAFTITADILIPPEGAHGVLVAQGGRFGGYCVYVHDGRVVFYYNAVDPRHYLTRSALPLAPGAHRIAVDFIPDSAVPGAAATVIIQIDGSESARGRVEQTLSTWISHSEGFDIGEDRTTAVSDEYQVADSRFTGTLQQLNYSFR
jgi:arylsulfatase